MRTRRSCAPPPPPCAPSPAAANTPCVLAATKPPSPPSEIRLPAPPDNFRPNSDTPPISALGTAPITTDTNLRGTADSVALWLAHHSDAIHAKKAPTAPEAKLIFDAVEQTRVEAIGAKQMAGVANNLQAKIETQFAQAPLAPPNSDDNQAQTIAHITALILRQELTGAKPPKSVAMAVDLWRPWVESRTGTLMQKLRDNINDQNALCRTHAPAHRRARNRPRRHGFKRPR